MTAFRNSGLRHVAGPLGLAMGLTMGGWGAIPATAQWAHTPSSGWLAHPSELPSQHNPCIDENTPDPVEAASPDAYRPSNTTHCNRPQVATLPWSRGYSYPSFPFQPVFYPGAYSSNAAAWYGLPPMQSPMPSYYPYPQTAFQSSQWPTAMPGGQQGRGNPGYAYAPQMAPPSPQWPTAMPGQRQGSPGSGYGPNPAYPDPGYPSQSFQQSFPQPPWQTTMPSGPGMGSGYPGYDPRQTMPGYPWPPAGAAASGPRIPPEQIQKLKEGLNVRPDQDPAWNKLVATIQGLSPTVGMNDSPEVQNAYQELMAVLDDNQRTKADDFRKTIIW